MTQVFPYEGAKIMDPEKGTFKVNTQQLKSYFWGRVSCKQAGHTSEHIYTSVVGSSFGSRSLGNIDIQGSQANDIKQSATWEATQAF